MNSRRASLWALALLGLLACSSSTTGSGGGNGSVKGATADGGTLPLCGNAPSGSCVTGTVSCVDSMGSASDIATLKSGCTSGGGTWSASACSHSGFVGGCCLEVGGVSAAQTTWVGAGNTSAAQEATQCKQGGGEWFQL